MSQSENIQAQKFEANWESIDKRETPQWFPDAKFGIFIHWGIYSVPAWAPIRADLSISARYAEWYYQRLYAGGHLFQESDEINNLFREHKDRVYGKNFRYQDFAPMFKAEEFNPDKWASIIKDAGAKYVILTSKHCEGFTLWPSPESMNWNSVEIGPHRDLCGDLSKSVKDVGLRMGFYYSLYEWYNPFYKTNPPKYVNERMIPQMKDLVSRYKPDLLYADAEWDYPSEFWKSEEFLAWLYNESPVKDTIAVNDRWGNDSRGTHGDYYSCEYGTIDGENKPSAEMKKHPWEEIRGIGSSFGYNQMEDINDYLTSEELIHMLIQIVADGGNLCLNIGPTASGLIPVIMQQRLKDMGEWLKVNGEAIYGTRAWTEQPEISADQDVFYTMKDASLYAIKIKWNDQPIIIPGIDKAKGVRLLGFSGNVKSEITDRGLEIYPPALNPGNVPCNSAWVYEVQKSN